MSECTQSHEHFMRRCVELAHQAKREGNTPVGSVVVLDDTIIGEGIERLPNSLQLTGHAEALACQLAVENSKSRILRGATLYSTAEPCFMCSFIIRQAEISRVVYAMKTPLIGGATSEFPVLTTDKLNAWKPAILVLGQVLAEEIVNLRRE
mgnify:CR=1 FL=1